MPFHNESHLFKMLMYDTFLTVQLLKKPVTTNMIHPKIIALDMERKDE